MRSLFIMALLAVVSPSAAADTFSVDSYIPQWFEDWQAYVSGAVNFSDNSQNQGASYDGDYRMAEISLKSDVHYRNITRDRDLILEGDIRVGGYAVDRTIDRQNIAQDRSDHSTFSREHFLFSISVDPTWRQYLVSDIFGKLELSAHFAYDQSPDAFTGDYGYDRTVFSDSVTIDRSLRNWSEPSVGRGYKLGMEGAVGFGRVYAGRFAYVALSIVDQLQSYGLISRELSHDEYMTLCDTVFYYRQAYTHDNRLLEIEALQAITGYLRSIGVLDAEPALAAIITTDVWKYYPTAAREFGHLIEVTCGASYSEEENLRSEDRYTYRLITVDRSSDPGVIDTTLLLDDHAFTTRTSYNELFDPYLGLRLAWHRPLSLRWQLDVRAEGNWHLNTYEILERREYPDREGTRREEYYDPFWSAAGSLELAYYVDARTTGSFGVHGGYDRRDRSEVDILYEGGIETGRGSQPLRRINDRGAVTVTGALTYRISLATTIRVESDYRYIEDRGTISRIHSAGALISHYLY